MLFSPIQFYSLVNRVQINDQWLATTFHAGVIILFLVFVYFVERKNFTESVR